jgi:hypothetical protein
VEPIDDLEGLRRSLLNPLDVQTTAISADNLDPEVRL